MPETGRDPSRPSPEALLDAARREERRRGRLKVFLGAAPGVGKTYEMLTIGRARLKAGTDAVVGVVETHGRAETEALLDFNRMCSVRLAEPLRPEHVVLKMIEGW